MECTLSEGELIRLEGGRYGMILRCTSGAVWLTKGDGTDYLVTPERCFIIAKGTTALAEALHDAEVLLEEPKTAHIPMAVRLSVC